MARAITLVAITVTSSMLVTQVSFADPVATGCSVAAPGRAADWQLVALAVAAVARLDDLGNNRRPGPKVVAEGRFELPTKGL
jgi:hypothetical protein